MSILASVITYVGDKILSQIIKDEVWSKRLYGDLFPRKNYKTELEQLLSDTIIDFRKRYPKEPVENKIQFFEDKETFEKLTMYILFEEGSNNILVTNFANKENVITPTQAEIDFFYNYFIEKVNSNKIIEILFIEENYKKQIFEVSNIIGEIQLTVNLIKEDIIVTKGIMTNLLTEKESKKLTPQKTHEALNIQVERQIKKQIYSGKYLQNTFIETGEQKDYLRYLCDSIFYSEKCFEEINNLDFRLLNIFLQKKHTTEFNLDFEKFKVKNGTMRIDNANKIINDWHNHLTLKKHDLKNSGINPNLIYKFERKFTDPLNNLTFLKSKVAIITEIAGQGKTNFLCDFSENFLLKRGIPALFLTGIEINAADIRLTILKRVFPDSTDYTFEDFLTNLKILCYEEKKYFVLIIDGLNENPNSTLLSQNLELFIQELLVYDYIRIVISCRTEYYQHNFLNLDKSLFVNEIQKITSIWNNNYSDDLKEKLFYIYFDHFNIKHRKISDKSFNQLTANFLLLRIFCEAYKNQDLDYIDNIYKEELFEKYYSNKSEEINIRLRENDDFKVTGNFDIKNFISNIVEYMIQTKKYVNVPLDNIIKEVKHREMYVRFLDENILIRRDLQADERGIFTPSEVVNFTFDEFRDFIISRYLIENLFINSQAEFVSFLESEITEKSPLLEGCSTFIFFISRRLLNTTLNDIISRQPWFDGVFSRCIFSLKDSQITDADKEKLKENLIKNNGFNESIIFNLISRHNTKYYMNLNINFLFESLRQFDQTTYEKCFVENFVSTRRENRYINQKDLIEELNDILQEKKIKENSSFHKLFELLIYMFTNKQNWSIISLYKCYFIQYEEIGKEQLRIALKSLNEGLTKELKQFISNYEISL